ncbi:MAG TPA: hypothetical protein VGK19_10755 [Capsulimonadaceae bacterium]
MTKLTSVLAAAAIMGTAILTPVSAHASNDSKNQWRNLGVAAAVIAGIGLLNHDKTLTAIGAAGAIYGASRYEQDRSNQSDWNHDRRGWDRNDRRSDNDRDHRSDWNRDSSSSWNRDNDRRADNSSDWNRDNRSNNGYKYGEGNRDSGDRRADAGDRNDGDKRWNR